MAALVVIGGVAIGGIVAIVHWTGSELAGQRSKVEVVLAVPENKPAESAYPSFMQSRQSAPQVDLTVRNSGQEQALLTRARITVEDSAWLPMCIVPGAGPIPIAGRYAVSLPFLPRSGERSVEMPLHDEVPAGKADRMKLYFQAPQIGEEDTVYALHVELEADGNEVIDVGRFVLAVPGAVIRNGSSLPENDLLLRSGGIDPDPSASAWCYRRNLSELRRVLALPGRRSAETAALSELRTAKGWPRLAAGALPPRQAVDPLLEDREIYGPVVAVYAAEQARDPQLIAETRKRAAAILLQRAEESLEESGIAAAVLEEAHASQRLVPSAAAKEVISRAESQQWEIEEEQEELTVG